MKKKHRKRLILDQKSRSGYIEKTLWILWKPKIDFQGSLILFIVAYEQRIKPFDFQGQRGWSQCGHEKSCGHSGRQRLTWHAGSS